MIFGVIGLAVLTVQVFTWANRPVKPPDAEFQKYVGYSIRDLVQEHGDPNLRFPGLACYLNVAGGAKPHVFVFYDPSGVWGPVSQVTLEDDAQVEQTFGYRVPRFRK